MPGFSAGRLGAFCSLLLWTCRLPWGAEKRDEQRQGHEPLLQGTARRFPWVRDGKWQHGLHSVAPSPTRQYARAEAAREQGNLLHAARDYEYLIAAYPEAPQAPLAHLKLVECYLELGYLDRAEQFLLEFRRRYRLPGLVEEATRLEVRLALHYLGRFYPELISQQEEQARPEGAGAAGEGVAFAFRPRYAEKLLRRVHQRDPNGPQGPLAFFGIGVALRAQGYPVAAEAHFQEFKKHYPDSRLNAAAEAQIVAAFLEMTPTPRYDEYAEQQHRERAQEAKAARLRDPVDKRTLEESLARLHDRQAERNYLMARLYQRNGYRRAAEVYYELILLHYADTKWAGMAREALRSPPAP